MATSYFPNESGSSSVRGILTYTTSQTDTKVTVNLSAVLQVNGRYGSGYQCLIKVNGTQVKEATGWKDPPAVAGWTQFLSTGNWSGSYDRGSTDKTITVEASFAGKAAGGYYAGSGSGSTFVTITIPALANPTVTQSNYAKTGSTISMSWSSNMTIDYVWCSTDGGSTWKAIGSANSSSGSYTISGLSPNTTYSVKTRLRGKSSQLTGDSSAVSVKTYAKATCTQSLASKTDTTIKMNWSSDSTCDALWYSTNGGTSWTLVGQINASSGTYTISGLTADTAYSIKTRVRGLNAGLTTDSSALSVTTYGYPTVSISLNSKTDTQIKINWSSGSTCDYAWYSINNGTSWVGVDVADGTSGVITISGLTADTSYTIKVRLRRKDSQYTRDSSALSVTTYGYPTVTQSLSSKTETTITIAWSSGSVCDYLWYSTNNGSSWTGVDVTDGTSGTYTISGLSANTAYNIKTRLRRKDSQYTRDSSALAVTTYDYPHATSMPNFTIGNQFTITVYNPLGRSFTLTTIGADNSELTTSSSYTGTSVTGFSAPVYLSFWYASIPNAKSGTYKVRINYGSIQRTNNGGTYSINTSACTPSIGALSYIDTNSTTTAVTTDNTKIVQNLSVVRYTASSLSVKNSATISSVKIAVNGQSYNLTVSGSSATGGNASIDSASNVTATATITDSRGLTATKTVTVQMLAWSLPSALISLRRQSNYYTESYLKCDAIYSSVNGKNTIAITYTGSAVPQTGKTTPASVSGSLSDNVQITLQLDNEFDWQFTIVLTDAFGTKTFYTQLSRGTPIMFWDDRLNSVGVGKFPSHQNAFEVAGDAYFGGEVYDQQNKKLSILTPYHITTTNTISTAGWYRAYKITFGSAMQSTGTRGTCIDFVFASVCNNTNNTVHRISLYGFYSAMEFKDETSRGANTTAISKIRYTTDGSGVGYIDVYYALSTANHINGSLFAIDSEGIVSVEDMGFASVGSAPSGETVRAEYTFNANVASVNQNGTATPASGVTLSETRVVRRGNTVEVKFYATCATAPAVGTETLLATISGVTLPLSTIRWLAGQGVHGYDAYSPAYAILQSSDGKIYVRGSQGSRPVFTIDVTYTVDS